MSKKHAPWFKEVRGSYLPCSAQGWLTYIPFILWLVLTIVIAGRDTESIWRFIYSLIPYWVSGAVVLHWIAKATSKK